MDRIRWSARSARRRPQPRGSPGARARRARGRRGQVPRRPVAPARSVLSRPCEVPLRMGELLLGSADVPPTSARARPRGRSGRVESDAEIEPCASCNAARSPALMRRPGVDGRRPEPHEAGDDTGAAGRGLPPGTVPGPPPDPFAAPWPPPGPRVEGRPCPRRRVAAPPPPLGSVAPFRLRRSRRSIAQADGPHGAVGASSLRESRGRSCSGRLPAGRGHPAWVAAPRTAPVAPGPRNRVAGRGSRCHHPGLASRDRARPDTSRRRFAYSQRRLARTGKEGRPVTELHVTLP